MGGILKIAGIKEYCKTKGMKIGEEGMKELEAIILKEIDARIIIAQNDKRVILLRRDFEVKEV